MIKKNCHKLLNPVKCGITMKYNACTFLILDVLSEDDADCEYDSGAEHFKSSYLTLFVMYGILSTIHSCIVTWIQIVKTENMYVS